MLIRIKVKKRRVKWKDAHEYRVRKDLYLFSVH
jgi:hypothetical protein